MLCKICRCRKGRRVVKNVDFRLVTMIAMTIVARTELDAAKLETLYLRASEYMN